MFSSSKAILGVVAALFVAHVTAAAPGQYVRCSGMCGASALVTVGSEYFVVANDEDNILRVYSRLQGGAPRQKFELSSFLQLDPKKPEVDIEAAAPLGDRVYWISSHGRNQAGKDRPNRHRFFATSLGLTNGAVSLKPIGHPYASLLTDLFNEPKLARFGLAAAARRAPKEKDALNIEGMCDTPEGQLLLGFRNPIPDGKSLVVPMLNPAEVVMGKRARFGDPLLLDLGGLGVRSLARSGNRYLIVAGSYDGSGKSFLYDWTGGTETPRRLKHPELRGLNPEAMEFVDEGGIPRLVVASDDGSMDAGGPKCKDLADANLRFFRVTTFDP